MFFLYCLPMCCCFHFTILPGAAWLLPPSVILLCFCGGFSKLVHIARSAPPSLALKELHAFDLQVRHTFTEYQSDTSWQQAQLSLSREGLGFRSLAHHSNAAFIASISSASLASPSDNFLAVAINSFNRCVPPESAVNIDCLASSPCGQHCLSAKLEMFNLKLFSPADKARLLSTRLLPVPLHGSLSFHLQAWALKAFTPMISKWLSSGS